MIAAGLAGIAHHHVLRAHRDGHVSALRQAIRRAWAGELDAADAHPARRRHLRLDEVHGADEIGDDGARRLTLDLLRSDDLPIGRPLCREHVCPYGLNSMTTR